MVKTIKLEEPTYKKLSRFGNVGQSFNDVVLDLIEFAEDNEEDFDEYIEDKYGEED